MAYFFGVCDCGASMVSYQHGGVDNIGARIIGFYYICPDCQEKENGGAEDLPEDTDEDD